MPLNVGTVHGGSAINVVPDRCVVEVGFRPLPGITPEELIERVSRAARAAAAPFEPAIELLSDSPPMLLDEAAPIHRHLCALVGQSAATQRLLRHRRRLAAAARAWTAPSSAPARSRWPTSPTSTCRRPNSPPPAVCWSGRSSTLRAAESRVT